VDSLEINQVQVHLKVHLVLLDLLVGDINDIRKIKPSNT
jgi:hypothetical protein